MQGENETLANGEKMAAEAEWVIGTTVARNMAAAGGVVGIRRGAKIKRITRDGGTVLPTGEESNAPDAAKEFSADAKETLQRSPNAKAKERRPY